ncbi:MAG: FUSC family protein [Cyanobacteria bacterium M_surface_10_m2_119]|nr:FUSC family protein [Cyanobacteria bacterium M_surface_10_m2_119]
MINRPALRTAVTTGLANAFASLSGVLDSQYAALAVLSVSTGTYGGAIELGRQRLYGSVLGALLLLVGYGGLKDLPLPVGLAITLGSLRLLGGLLQLKVGYKVGGMIIVMGWLVHEGSLASWLPLRFFWTAFGVLLTLLSLRLFWPARSLEQILASYANLLSQLQLVLRDLRQGLEEADTGSALAGPARRSSHYPTLRNRLQAMRGLRPNLLQELGTNPERHPAALLLASLDGTASRLVTLVRAMERAALSPQPLPQLARLHRAEADLLGAMADQLQHWERAIRGPAAGEQPPGHRQGPGLPPPPSQGLVLPSSWLQLNRHLNDPAVNTANSARLERIAVRLQLCSQAERAIRDGEARWAAILDRR